MEKDISIHTKAYFNVLKTASWIEDNIKESLRPFNLTHAQLNILHTVMVNDPNPVSPKEIRDLMLVSNPDVTRLLDRLVKKELVLRNTCPLNRRKVDITFTDKGRQLFMDAHQAAKVSVGNFFESKISAEEAKTLREILHKVMK